MNTLVIDCGHAVALEATITPRTGEPALRLSLNKCVEWSVTDDARLCALRDWLNTHLPEQPTVPADAVQFDDMETAR